MVLHSGSHLEGEWRKPTFPFPASMIGRCTDCITAILLPKASPEDHPREFPAANGTGSDFSVFLHRAYSVYKI